MNLITKFIYRSIFIGGIYFAGFTSSYAQSGVGSSTVDNSEVSIATGTTELRFSEQTYFGPDAQWEINGTLEIWSKKIWISPTARFTGAGRIIIHDPGTNPYYNDMTGGPTQIDGNNGRFIETTIELRNPSNLILTELTDPGYGTVNATGSKAAALNIGGLFEFAIDGGDVILNGFDFGIAPNSYFTNYNPKRMIVTGNSIAGHVIKYYSSLQPFVFPVGIAEGDYTPATLTPSAAAAFYVSVQNYSASVKDGLSGGKGMDRIWHIFADKNIAASYTLQHNSNTNGTNYVDATAQIVQYAGSANWTAGQTNTSGAGIHTRTGVTTTTDLHNDASWFTKLSSAIAANFFIPNVITPDGDGKNDSFTIVGTEAFDRIEVEFVNRWGNQVYVNRNYKNNWQGENLNEGTYYYTMKLIKGSETTILKGWVLIKR
ncbi:MAG: gliding motility-associated C-terminal domain-containing protein [Bacteroidota bacterium]